MSLIKLNFFTKNVLVLISVSKLRSRNFPVSISVLVSKKFYGLGLESCGLEYITGRNKRYLSIPKLYFAFTYFSANVT